MVGRYGIGTATTVDVSLYVRILHRTLRDNQFGLGLVAFFQNQPIHVDGQRDPIEGTGLSGIVDTNNHPPEHAHYLISPAQKYFSVLFDINLFNPARFLSNMYCATLLPFDVETLSAYRS